MHPFKHALHAVVALQLAAGAAGCVAPTDEPSTAEAADPIASVCTVYVANGGDDANSGTKAHPFKTLERARDHVRTLQPLSGPVSVCLRGGTHRLAHTFVLSPEDSGTEATPITYRSYPGERAALSGGRALHPTWTPYSGAIWKTPVKGSFRSLFVNGTRAVRARSPNGDATFTLTPVADPVAQRTSFLYEPGSVDPSMPAAGAEIVSMERWMSPRQRLGAVDATTAYLNGTLYTNYGYDYDTKDRYYVENTLAALDAPGEWYLDDAAHELYYWPRDAAEITSGKLVVPELFQLVRGGDYPENTALLGVWQAVAGIDVCRHVGVLPKASQALSFGEKSFTIALRVRFPDGTTNPFWAFTRGNPWGLDAATGAGGDGYGLGTYSTAATVPIQFFVNDGTHRISADVPAQPRGTWMHLAFVVNRKGDKMKAYLDGTLVDTKDIAALGSIASSIPLDIGAYTNLGCSTSALADFRVYSRALPAAEVASLAAGAPPASGLALSLPFDGDFDDASPHAHRTVPFYAPAFVAGPGTSQAADFATTAPLDLSGSVDHIGFADIDFEYTDWTLPFTGYPGAQGTMWWSSPSAVYLHSVGAVISNSTFSHTGSHALAGMMQEAQVLDSTFTDIGGSAIKIGQTYLDEASNALLAPWASQVTIAGNHVSTTGVVVHDSESIMVFEGSDDLVYANAVTDAPHIGLSVGWFTTTAFGGGGNNLVALNHVDHVMKLLNDGGGLYILGYQPGTVVERNVFHDVVRTAAHKTYSVLPYDLIWGIYLDGTSNSMLVRDNLAYRTQDGGIMLNDAVNGNGNNTVTNNIFVDGLAWQLFFLNATADAFHNNIVYSALAPSSPVFYAAIGTSDNNLFFSPSVDLQPQVDYRTAVYGQEAASIVADPLFLDYASDDFTLSTDSPAVKPSGAGGIDFVPIDFTGLP